MERVPFFGDKVSSFIDKRVKVFYVFIFVKRKRKIPTGIFLSKYLLFITLIEKQNEQLSRKHPQEHGEGVNCRVGYRWGIVPRYLVAIGEGGGIGTCS